MSLELLSINTNFQMESDLSCCVARIVMLVASVRESPPKSELPESQPMNHHHLGGVGGEGEGPPLPAPAPEVRLY